MTLATLASDIASTITLASRSIPHVDRNGPPGIFDVRADRFAKVREQYPHAVIIRYVEPGRYTVFGTVYDALPLEAWL